MHVSLICPKCAPADVCMTSRAKYVYNHTCVVSYCVERALYHHIQLLPLILSSTNLDIACVCGTWMRAYVARGYNRAYVARGYMRMWHVHMCVCGTRI